MRKSQVPVFLIVITATLAAFVFSCLSLQKTTEKAGAQLNKSNVPEFHVGFLAEENGSEEDHLKKPCCIHPSTLVIAGVFLCSLQSAASFQSTPAQNRQETFLLHRQLLI